MLKKSRKYLCNNKKITWIFFHLHDSLTDFGTFKPNAQLSLDTFYANDKIDYTYMLTAYASILFF